MSIDFHAHILPNMDDGSKSVQASVRMLDNAWRQGVRKIVCTSHFWPLATTVPAFLKKRQAASGLLGSVLDKKSPKRMPKLVLGAECGWVKNISRYPELEALCIEGTDFLLLELPMGEWTDDLFEELYRLNIERGICPIIAHPDRYSRSIKKLQAIPKFAQLDCLFQLNVDAVLNLLDRPLSIRLLSGPVPCVLGSDVHDDAPGAQRFSKAEKAVSRHLGAEKLQTILTVSNEILNNSSFYELRSIWEKTALCL